MKRYAPLLVLWLLVVASGIMVETRHDRLFVPPEDQRESGDIILDVFGEFRTVMARYLWFKMDLFHEVLDDEGVAHEKQAEVMPLLRMVSLLDPTITDAYDVIAWDLYKGHHMTKEAIAVIREGLMRNPSSQQLQFRLAMLLFADEQYGPAKQAALQAEALSTEEFDILNSTRLVYWSSKHLGDEDAMRKALDRLIALRPTDALWTREKAELEKSRTQRNR
jgi:hypothetical protein